MNNQMPKILTLDLETAPVIAHVWGLWDQNVGLSQIVSDTYIMSYAAKFIGDKKVYQRDQRNQVNMENDKALVKELRDLINSADIVVTHNGDNFDIKRFNTRCLFHGIAPAKSITSHDTLRIVKRNFQITSNKLEYIAKFLKCKLQKLKHEKFSGHVLWMQCLKGNQSAWKAMAKYNIYDVLVLEEVYLKLQPWTDFSLTGYMGVPTCSCGSNHVVKNGIKTISTKKTFGKYQRYVCQDCGKEHLSKTNLLNSKQKKGF